MTSRTLVVARLALGGLTALITLAGLAACVGTTGSALVGFHAYAAGPEDARPGEPLRFENGLGFHVTLTRAVVHVGGVYLNRSLPISGGQDQACTSAGIYVGQVLGPVEVDTLSPELQPFAVGGSGTADHAVSGEVWLTGGDPGALADTTVILDAAGTAERDGETNPIPFEARLTIGENRIIPATDPARPGANPLCKQRIVRPVPVDITPTPGGALVLRVDPRAFFANVDFAQLPPSEASSLSRAFLDRTDGQPNVNLYGGLRATGAYRFTWRDEP